ncbi:MAG: PIN domain-containing protein [Pseudomonadota bacterium]
MSEKTSAFVLVDFENVQPRNLELLTKRPFKVRVFVGANQTKVPVNLAAAMQKLGDRAEYVFISGSGRNALDFHIAFYLGELAAGHPDTEFFVVSRDRGFDPVIRHLNEERNIGAKRVADVAEIPSLRISAGTSQDEQIQAIVKNLKSRGRSVPRKVSTLRNTIRSLIAERFTDEQLDELIAVLKKRGIIEMNKNNVRYHLPRNSRPRAKK